MRITKQEIDSIKSAILSRDPKAKIYLFGSRTDPSAKGGDIDILVFSDLLETKDIRPIKTAIFEVIEEQKIDVLIVKDNTDPFVKIALKTGILL